MVVRRCFLFESCCCSDTVVDLSCSDIDLGIVPTFVGCPHSLLLLQVVVDNSPLDDHRNTFHKNGLVDAFVIFVFVLDEFRHLLHLILYLFHLLSQEFGLS